ncbi:MAG: radical SAM protein [Lentisphaerae bacterium]|nr:radical SAM protein [Lentisphaerota bacterium]MCP4100060.1 radical SAM protein [Lentisphaerota bacterium]
MRPHGSPLALRAVAWETTKRCGMNCRHCRAEAVDKSYSGELSTAEGFRLIDGLAEMGRCILILTGGEPMVREDIYELSAYAVSKGLDVVMAPCGSLVNPETVKLMKSSGVRLISLSIDGPDAEIHDEFRGVKGAFQNVIDAAEYARAGEMPVQINTTVSKLNVNCLSEIHELVIGLKAQIWDLFFLVPTGRGAEVRDLEINSAVYEKTLNWIYNISQSSPLSIKVTCAPHYGRVQRRRAGDKFMSIPPRFRARGCLGGKGFIFISHCGIVQPCGFLNLNCGDLRKVDFDLKNIYEKSLIFQNLRDEDKYQGSCGDCDFVRCCGGCRARAFEETGNYLAEEPSCLYGKND